MELRPLQEPHPPIRYPSSTPGSAAAIGRGAGYNFVTLGAVDAAKTCIDAFVSTCSGPFGPALDFPGGAAIGVSRHVAVGETVEDDAGPFFGIVASGAAPGPVLRYGASRLLRMRKAPHPE